MRTGIVPIWLFSTRIPDLSTHQLCRKYIFGFALIGDFVGIEIGIDA